LILAQNGIDVWLAFDRQIDDEARLRELAAQLEPQELERGSRFYFSHDRQQFLVTRSLQRVVLADYLGARPVDLRFAAGAHGKPALAMDGPPLHFNIAHSAGLIAMAVSRESLLGIDVENMVARPPALTVAGRYFTAQEAGELAALPAADQPGRFYALWTLKESWLKATGRGLAAGLANVSFEFGANHLVSRVTLAREAASPWRFWQAQPTREHLLALAVRASQSDAVRKWTVTLRRWMPGETPGNLPHVHWHACSGEEQRAQA
jgi:4'-phosphopantetheinyl transferase